MPGIAGIISETLPDKNKMELNLMLHCMMHETIYSSGTYVNDQLGLYAGWVCRKGSFSDCMPVFNEKRDLVLLFSGENYADKQVMDALKRNGHTFDPYNASYLIHLYEDKGDDFLKGLNGSFTGIIVDLRNEKVLFFNDRIGIQKIYYYESDEAFLFSSEAKSLLRVRPRLKNIDLASLGQYYTCGCTLQNRTLFSNIFLMPGGSAWTFRKGSNVKKDYYFKCDEWENQTVLKKEVFYQKLRETFQNILPRYFFSKEKVGMSLTGGLDSRLIMSCADHQPGDLPCYTFGGPYADNLDVRIARQVANACQQSHHVLRLDRGFFSEFPSHAEKTIYITDGCLHVNGSHEIFLNRLAREIAPIRMTGNYGSEVLRSHSTYKAFCPNRELFRNEFYDYVQGAKRTFDNIKLKHKLSDAIFREIAWLLSGRLALEQSQLTLRSPFIDNDLLKIAYQAPARARANNQISLRLIADNNSELIKINTNQGVLEGSNSTLSKCSQLFNYLLFKADYYYDMGMTHWMAKLNHTFAPLHAERFFLGVHRLHHYRIWFHNELSAYVREILLDERTKNRPYLNKRSLEKMVYHHIKGDRNYSNEINKTLSVELIQRLLIDQG